MTGPSPLERSLEAALVRVRLAALYQQRVIVVKAIAVAHLHLEALEAPRLPLDPRLLGRV